MKRTLALTVAVALAAALLTPALALAGTVFEMEMRQPDGPTEATRLMVEGTNLRTALPADTFADPGYPRQRLEMPGAGR